MKAAVDKKVADIKALYERDLDADDVNKALASIEAEYDGAIQRSLDLDKSLQDKIDCLVAQYRAHLKIDT